MVDFFVPCGIFFTWFLSLSCFQKDHFHCTRKGSQYLIFIVLFYKFKFFLKYSKIMYELGFQLFFPTPQMIFQKSQHHLFIKEMNYLY